ncbi:MAG: glycoside hydrolase family 5 protein [Oscillospiraceae bacterium]|nr:glycoside hydrolase family 5 protein [Oscillospiraceae bacterium]
MKKILKSVLITLLSLMIVIGAVVVWRLGLWLPGRVENPTIPETPGFEMVKDMQLGWNLGNTLEAHVDGIDGLESETSWGNPVTTQEIINTVKAAGFKTLRIPVTWASHMGDAPDYTIDSAWLDRVQEIVDYGYSTGMYVVINLHHDDQYWFIPNKKHEEAAAAQFVALWEQVSERFSDYGERLLFESANEPRVVGSFLEWGGGTISERAVVNRLSAKFVDTVRKSGGNNAQRWLVINTYGASYEPVPMRSLKLPDDDRLIVSVHAYYPRGFAFDNDLEDRVFTEKVRKSVDKMLGQVYRTFIAKGIPVFMGEFGASTKDNANERVKYAAHYITEAKRYGIACAWWDNGYFLEDNEDVPPTFALLDRHKLQWVYPEIAEAMRQAAE